ncbi:hypothetical protein DFLDMN_006197 (plasmid) [Cupriavidus sp. H19C3]
MSGIQPALVLGEIEAHGFCALDEFGVEREFAVPPHKASFPASTQSSAAA